MFVFGVCIDAQEVFDRHCLPAIAAFGGTDATLITSTDKPIASTYNEMLQASLGMEHVEALVLLRQDVEITDPRFLSKVRRAFDADPCLAIIGPRLPDAPGHGPRPGATSSADSTADVDSVDDTCMILRPHLAARLRFDDASFTGASGFDVDFCFRAREQGFRVAREAIDVVRHGTGRRDDDAFRSAAAVWQGKRAARLRAELLQRIAERTPEAEQQEPTAGVGSAPAAESGYDLTYPELIEHLPARTRRVLDVGCGSGSRGLEIKRASGAHVTGIEHGDAAARLARTRLDEVHELDLTTAQELPWQPAPYDVIVLADVLARLADPERVLRLLLDHLAPDGTVLLTVPNVKHWSVVLPLLLEDRWEYQGAGPLHFANLRFYTMVEIAGLLRRVGLGTFDTCAAQQLPLEDQSRLQPLLDAVAAYGGDADEARTLLNSYQYVVAARRD